MLVINNLKLSGITFQLFGPPPTSYLGFSMQGGSIPNHFIQTTSDPVYPISSMQGGSIPNHFIQTTSDPVCPINTVSS